MTTPEFEAFMKMLFDLPLDANAMKLGALALGTQDWRDGSFSEFQSGSRSVDLRSIRYAGYRLGCTHTAVDDMQPNNEPERRMAASHLFLSKPDSCADALDELVGAYRDPEKTFKAQLVEAGARPESPVIAWLAGGSSATNVPHELEGAIPETETRIYFLVDPETKWLVILRFLDQPVEPRQTGPRSLRTLKAGYDYRA